MSGEGFVAGAMSLGACRGRSAGSNALKAECKAVLMWTLGRGSWRDSAHWLGAKGAVGLGISEAPALTLQRAWPKRFTTSRSRGRFR